MRGDGWEGGAGKPAPPLVRLLKVFSYMFSYMVSSKALAI